MKSRDKKNRNRKSRSNVSGAEKGKRGQFPVLDFFAEAGLLKRVRRSGWWVAGIKDPETVADHCFRCAVIGFYLAHLENADPYKVLVMTVFNDIHEARINDLHKMGHYYIDFKDAEKKVFDDQVRYLDERVKSDLKRLRGDYDRQSSREALVARDADILECLLQAKEYFDSGHLGVKEFFKRAPGHLKTGSARKLWQQLRRWNSHEWWTRVVKFER